jgi:O-antigen chain-terminating methyltransferase
MIKNKKKLIALLYLNYINLFNKTEMYQPSYNSSRFLLFNSQKSQRLSDDRLDAMIKNLKTKNGSYLDIGSQIGYFVFYFNKLGFFSTGIEMNSYSSDYASCLSILNKIKNISFINDTINQNSVKNLPDFDVVSILSVFHHLVYFQGKVAAEEILSILISKCKNTFYFETGEFEEKGFYWTESLSFFGNKSQIYIKDYLQTFGFSEVRCIGKYRTHLTDHKRSLFVCHK